MNRLPHFPRQLRWQSSGLDFDFTTLATRASGLYRVSSLLLTFAGVVGGLKILVKNPEWLWPYLMVIVPGLALLWFWNQSKQKALPLLPVFCIQNLLLYGLPLAAQNPSVERVSPEILQQAGLAMALFVMTFAGAWQIAWKIAGPPKKSTWNFALVEGKNAERRCLSLAHVLLGGSVVFYLLLQSGFISTMLPGEFFPLARTFATVASILGGILGALVLGKKSRQLRSILYWLLVMVFCLLSAASLLISAASGIVIAIAVGLALGSGRVPWKFLIVCFSLVGFLNQGKFVMRGRYWDAATNSASVKLTQFPAFFKEWTEASLSVLSGDTEQKSLEQKPLGQEDEAEGQSIVDRIDNLQNLTFVLDAMESGNIKPLYGETYTLIPKLLIPRIFWPDKPIAHEGQVLLNLHFGRQQTVEQTAKTFIAWGLIPEAVGNFGRFFGPLIGGLVLGYLVGAIEAYSRRIRLFSIEGIVLLALLLSVAGSYEMVASVLVTSLFQFLVVTVVSGVVLYSWFGGAIADKIKPQRRNHPNLR